MLVKRSLVLVAVLFLCTTIVLFLHLQEIRIEENSDLTNQSSDMETNTKATDDNIAQESPLKTIESVEKEEINSVSNERTNSASEQPFIATNQFNDVHVFYYPWYANIETDGKWNHWDHHILPHWDAAIKAQVFHPALNHF